MLKKIIILSVLFLSQQSIASCKDEDRLEQEREWNKKHSQSAKEVCSGRVCYSHFDHFPAPERLFLDDRPEKLFTKFELVEPVYTLTELGMFLLQQVIAKEQSGCKKELSSSDDID